MRLYLIPVVSLILIVALVVGIKIYYNGPVLKKVEIIATNDANPAARVKAGELIFYRDYTYKITGVQPELKEKLTAAIKAARSKENLLLRYEEKKGDALVMYGEQVGPEDKNYIFALLNEVAEQLNRLTRDLFYSFEISKLLTVLNLQIDQIKTQQDRHRVSRDNRYRA